MQGFKTGGRKSGIPNRITTKLKDELSEHLETYIENQFNEERMRWKNNVYGEYDRLEALRKRDKDTLEEQVSTATQRFDADLARET